MAAVLLSSVRGGVRVQEVKQTAHSLAAGTRVSRPRASDLPGSEIHAFPLARRAGKGWGGRVSQGPPQKGMKEAPTKKSEKAGPIFIRYDEANRSGGDFY